MGIIAVETRTVERVNPADPAVMDSKESVVQQVTRGYIAVVTVGRQVKCGSQTVLTKLRKRSRISTTEKSYL
jgi:hypothetical protein